MDFDESTLFNIMEEISHRKDIKISDIPDIELYMDQVTTFIDNKLGYNKRVLKDKILTKTMINNYTKSKILLPSKNKRYNKQHMILLILIYYLKQILSINDINLLFAPMFKNITSSANGADYLENLYNAFIEVKENGADDLQKILSQKFDLIEEKTEKLPLESKEISKILLTVLTLVATAAIQKRIAEKIIDDYLIK
ncbi:MAG: DUF1836 domain-containing protein [Clostridiaceae bacterium]|nr:DUF1836 domain-containing protein [Clostridiaceae bacterium]